MMVPDIADPIGTALAVRLALRGEGKDGEWDGN
jgi:hypothetical protein